mmetsp:Transcript_11687/g.31480  ORF Transcript_11687/g.31480 Transcript_11687/m.31480 type:complete len:196 (-) Transcript_11687:595-1182(-)
MMPARPLGRSHVKSSRLNHKTKREQKRKKKKKEACGCCFAQLGRGNRTDVAAMLESTSSGVSVSFLSVDLAKLFARGLLLELSLRPEPKIRSAAPIRRTTLSVCSLAGAGDERRDKRVRGSPTNQGWLRRSAAVNLRPLSGEPKAAERKFCPCFEICNLDGMRPAAISLSVVALSSHMFRFRSKFKISIPTHHMS